MEMIDVLLLIAVAAALLLCVLAARRLERRYDSLRDEVGDDWMFGHRGGKGLFVTRRVI